MPHGTSFSMISIALDRQTFSMVVKKLHREIPFPDTNTFTNWLCVCDAGPFQFQKTAKVLAEALVSLYCRVKSSTTYPINLASKWTAGLFRFCIKAHDRLSCFQIIDNTIGCIKTANKLICRLIHKVHRCWHPIWKKKFQSCETKFMHYKAYIQYILVLRSNFSILK